MSDPAPSLPFVLADRYEVTAELGRGGFAIVYRASDRVLERDVAIKILRGDVLPPSAARRFSLEMRVTARLKHPNILHVYDTGTWDQRMYYVMEYVRGRTLEARIAAEGALPLDDAFTIAREIGEALAFAHDEGVIHRDIKPANIMLGPTGALLGDFGIARVLADTLHGPVTSTGVAVGTLQYMSPEQLCADKVDARTDQYSLALILYEMLTGVRPHAAGGVEALRALRLSGSHAPVVAHRPSVPEFVNDAIAKALSPAPADRFRDMREFLIALDGVGTHEQAAASVRRQARGSSTPAAKASSSAWLNRRAEIAGGVVLGLGALIGALYLRLLRSSDPVTGATVSVAFLATANPSDSAFGVRMRTELDDWHDVNLIRGSTASVAGPDGASVDTYRSLASRWGATVLVRPSRETLGDSTRWSLSVYDARSPTRVVRVSRWSRGSSELSAEALRALAARLLVGATADSAPGIETIPVSTLGAASAYAKGWRLMRVGAFDSSKVAFAAAAQQAPEFAEARLWTAQVGMWTSPKNAVSWRDEALQASEFVRLHGTDSLLARALAASAKGETPVACARYRDAIAGRPDSFAAWYGLGQCQQYDSAVVTDARVPGGVRFRTSHWSALAAYEQALARLPAQGMSSLFADVTLITYASGNWARSGVGVGPDTARYYALPSLDGDSIVTIPITRARMVATNSTPESFSRAVDRGRRRLLDFTREWALRAPDAADAWFYRAYALELTGALDAPEDFNSATRSLRIADSLSVDSERRAKIDAARVRVAVRRGAFDEASALAKAAVSRADRPTARVAMLRAPLAAFTGNVDATITLLRTAATSTDPVLRHQLPPWAANGLPVWLADSLRAFGVRAALGICDGLGLRRDQLERDLPAHVAQADLADQRATLLQSVYVTAVPCLGASVIRGFTPHTPLEEAITSLDRGDSSSARATLDLLNRSRRGVSVATVTEDAVLPEVWVWTQLGDTAQARAIIRNSMRDVVRISPFTFDEVPLAAALARVHRLATVPK